MGLPSYQNNTKLETVIWIIVAIVWMVISARNQAAKKKAEEAKRTQKAPNQPTAQQQTPAEPESIKDIFEELRRKAEAYSTEQKEARGQKEPMLPKQKKKAGKQVKELTAIEQKEKQSYETYRRFVDKQRRKSHESRVRQTNILDEAMREEKLSHEAPPAIEIDLKNLIISDAVLNRPYQ